VIAWGKEARAVNELLLGANAELLPKLINLSDEFRCCLVALFGKDTCLGALCLQQMLERVREGYLKLSCDLTILLDH
jgi:hypothetical protein